MWTTGLQGFDTLPYVWIRFLDHINYIISHWKLALEIIETSLGSSWLLGWSQVNTIDSGWQCCLAVSSSQVLGIFTSFNNREPKQIYFASSAPDACQVHLQNLVLASVVLRSLLVIPSILPSVPISVSQGSPKMDPNFNDWVIYIIL